MGIYLSDARLRNYIIRNVWWRASAYPLDRYTRKDRASRLLRIDLKPTTACNMCCEVCGQWGPQGYYRRSPELVEKDLPLSEYERLIDDMARWRPMFYLWGGEPLLYPNLGDLVRLIRLADAPCYIVTNGLKLRDVAEDLVDASPDVVMVSLDGPEEVHNQMRGRKGAFSRILEGMYTLQDIKRSRGTIYPLLFTTTTITERNASSVVELYEKLKDPELDIKAGILALAWSLSEQMCDAYEKRLQNEFDVAESPRARAFCHGISSEHIRALCDTLTTLKKLELPFKWTLFPDLSPGQIERFYREPEKGFSIGSCRAIYYSVQIAANGDVSCCRDFPDIVHGNITKHGLRDILNNDSFTAFRRSIAREPLPVCSRCCNLYEQDGKHFPVLKL